ncbi:nuclear pore complex protein NUP58-like [Aristolochia californica]|uniref:nuclear pore complex protein NUP58-like n=1 Tax=Aristolochia californica TaxID=171875 RepID=UPI0035E1B0F6
MAFSFFAPTPQPQQQQSLFQTPPQSSPFIQQQQLQQQQPQQQLQQQQFYLFTSDKSPAHYNTKWSDLHPDSLKILLQIEERILEYRDESQRLDQCSRLYDSSVTNDGFELDASNIVQELGGVGTAMEKEKVLLQELMAVVKDMMRNTEIAVRSFMILRPRFIHSGNPTSNLASTAQMSSGAIVSTPTSQPMSTSIAAVFDFYSGNPKRPSPFLEQTVSRFEKYLGECRQWIEELEQLLLSNGDGGSSRADSSLLQSLPKVMSNVHDFFIHVAAKVENLHQYIESMKTAYLADQKHRGDANNPFLEADRRETAKQEAAARRVHPTLHLPAQLPTQVASPFASSSQVTTAVPQPSIGAPVASTGSGFSMFGTPSSSAPLLTVSSSPLFSTPSASAPTSSLFGTPSFSPQPSVLGSASTSLYGSVQTPLLTASSSPLFSTPPASAPTSSLFGTPSFAPQPSVLGSASTSLYGSVQTPSLFGASTPSFSSTPAIGGSSLFSTPFASGGATGSGASFGAASKSSKAKSRTARR